MINIKWRPQTDNLINACVNLIFKDQNGLVYELDESDSLQIRSNETLRKYKIAGLTLEVLCPFRKLRIKVRGYLRRKDTNELIYTRFHLFWSPLSNVFDFQNDFDDQFIAKELSSLGNKLLSHLLIICNNFSHMNIKEYLQLKWRTDTNNGVK